MLTVLDLFSGIGGFSLGLERAGMKTVAFCEIDQFCRKVLNKHWPGIPIFSDIKQLSIQQLIDEGVIENEESAKNGAIDVVCGGTLIKTNKGILCESCDMEDEQTMRVISRTKDQPTEQEEQDNEFTQ